MDSFFFSEKTVEQQTAELVRILKANAANKEVVDAISKQGEGSTFYTNEARSAKNAVIVAIKNKHLTDENGSGITKTFYFSKTGELEGKSHRTVTIENQIKTTCTHLEYSAHCSGQHPYNKNNIAFRLDDDVHTIEEIFKRVDKEKPGEKWTRWEVVSSSSERSCYDQLGRFHNSKGSAVVTDNAIPQYFVHGKPMPLLSEALTKVLKSTAEYMAYNCDVTDLMIMEDQKVSEVAEQFAKEELRVLQAKDEKYIATSELRYHHTVRPITEDLVRLLTTRASESLTRRELIAWCEVAKLKEELNQTSTLSL